MCGFHLSQWLKFENSFKGVISLSWVVQNIKAMITGKLGCDSTNKETKDVDWLLDGHIDISEVDKGLVWDLFW